MEHVGMDLGKMESQIAILAEAVSEPPNPATWEGRRLAPTR